jgi:hypothetical protein
MSISGPIYGTRLEPIGDLHRIGVLGEALGNGIMDTVLLRNAVGAHAGLAGIPIFRGDRTLDRHFGFGVSGS